MNKSALALAVASALAASAAAQAETTLYGSARVSVDYQKADLLRFEQVEDVFDVFDNGVWDVVNNTSRLGVRGSEDLGNGLSAIYQYEFGVDMTEGSNFESNRPKLVGLKGGFGTVSVGTQWTPYYNVTGITDIFNSSRTFGGFPFARLEDVGNFIQPSYLGLFRLDNSLIYQTPNWSGFSGEAMLVMNGKTGSSRVPDLENSVDLWNINVKYANGPLFLGLTYLKFEGQEQAFSVGDTDQWALGAGYEAGPFAVGFMYEDGKISNASFRKEIDPITGDVVQVGPRDRVQNYYGTLSYAFGENIIRAAYGYVDAKDGSGETVNNYALGYQYNFSKRTRLWVEYIGWNGDDFEIEKPSSISFSGTADTVSVGVRHDF